MHEHAPARMGFLREHPEFFKLWSGQAVSSVGSSITTVAMPLAAVVMLNASPLQMGLLSALTVLPHLLFGLLAGVWVDRLRHRAILIVADLGRALVLGVVPVLGFLQLLRIEHLYIVTFLTGLMTLLFDTAATSLVPALVGRANLLRANSALVLKDTVARTAGPTLAGWLGQVLAGLGPPLYSVPQTTLRQSLVPDHVLGRVNATWRFLVFGVQPLGALLGGALGATIGLRATLVASSLGMLAGCLWASMSPVRSLRHIPATTE